MTDFFVLRDLSSNENIELSGVAFKIGRHDTCDIVLDNDEASRWHAQFSIRQGQLYLEDLGSTNGTYINKRELKGEHVVAGGDVVTIGEQSFLVIEPGSAGNTTIFGARLGSDETSFVVDQSDPDETALRMALSHPPGWTAKDEAFFSESRESQHEKVMENLIRNQSIDTHSNVAAFMVTSERRHNDLFLVPKIMGKTQWSLGRAPASDVTVDDVTVSASHASLKYENGAWLIDDNVSTNGTKVNGNRAKSTRLNRGDTVSLGTLELLFMPLEPS